MAWRRAACRELPRLSGLRFAKAMGQIGGRSTNGFGAGVPDPRRQVALLAWSDPEAPARFTEAHPLGRALADGTLLEVLAARGSHYGRRPLTATAKADERDGGAIGVLTLGRASPRTLARFLRDGARLSSDTLGAPGLVSAVSAGFPLTGNATFSVWRSERHMLDFAYGKAGRHRATAAAKPPILLEQLSARLRPVATPAACSPS